VFWLIAVAFAAVLPHFYTLPLWISAVVLATFLFVFLRARAGYQPLSARIKIPLVFAGLLGILWQYRAPLSQEFCVAILTLFMSLKLTELRARRDLMALIALGYFLLLTHYFQDHGLFTSFWMFGSALLVTASLLVLHDSPGRPVQATLKTAARLLLQALPLMLVFYLFFPRVEGPLWRIPASEASRTGLSGKMSPGQIARLAQSGEIAFRARFAGAPPPRAQLYWRGPVLTRYDGQNWEAEDFPPRPPRVEAMEPTVSYTLTLEAHRQHWLLPLDMPIAYEGVEAFMTRNGLLRSVRPVSSRLQLRMRSAPRYRMDIGRLPRLLEAANLQLPAGYNPKTLALARQWRETSSDGRELAARALAYFRDEPFYYTLEPPLLGVNVIDDFLFNTRRGFCEHYAAAFVTLMRAAGVPARVVTGYLGGEINPVDHFLVVRQSAAHAWAEIWTSETGWRRMDPTAVIPLDRVSPEALAAQSENTPERAADGLSSPGWLTRGRYYWEAANNLWNQWALGYTPERQRALMARLGMKNSDWKALVRVLVFAAFLTLTALAAFILRRRSKARDAVWHIWQTACRRLARKGVDTPAWETPLALAARLMREKPPRVARKDLLAAERLARLVTEARYMPDPPPLAQIRAALKQIGTD
jgi:transglutaminase-like putative cysteine protease